MPGINSDSLHIAMSMRDIDMLRLHLPNLHRTCDLNNTQDIHDTVFKVGWWCYCNHFDQGLMACLEAGLSPDFTDETGEESILAQAARNTRNNIVSLLLSKGAEANKLSVHGRSALLEAALANNVEGINLLFQAGCDLNIEDSAQFTPLLNAITEGATLSCIRLIELGADTNLSFSFSSLGDLARAMGHDECAMAVETAIATKCAEQLQETTYSAARTATRRNL